MQTAYQPWIAAKKPTRIGTAARRLPGGQTEYGRADGSFGPRPAAGMPQSWGGSSDDILSRIMGKDGMDPNQPMAEMLAESFRLRDEGERRRTETMGFLERERGMANVPTLTDEDVRREHTMESDRFAQDSMQGMRDLRAFMGEAGITGGGMPAGMAAQIDLQRYGLSRQAGSKLRLKKAETDALDRAAHFQRGLGTAAVMNEDPSMLGLDATTNATDWRTQIMLGLQGLDVARSGQKAQERAGQQAMFGGIAQGVLGLI